MTQCVLTLAASCQMMLPLIQQRVTMSGKRVTPPPLLTLFRLGGIQKLLAEMMKQII